MRAKGGYVYIISNLHRTVYYIGVTSNLYVGFINTKMVRDLLLRKNIIAQT